MCALAAVDPAVVEGGLDARLVALLRRPEGWPPYRGGESAARSASAPYRGANRRMVMLRH